MPCLPSSFFNQLAIAILIREEQFNCYQRSAEQVLRWSTAVGKRDSEKKHEKQLKKQAN
jgi:hypothetical protein